MAPKKKEQQKMSLGDFLTDSGLGGGSWADEVEETYVTGTQPLPAPDRLRPSGGMSSGWQDRGYSSLRENLPQTIPDKPPYTAHLGNLSYDATVESVTEFFEGCGVVSVRIIEDREMQRPKGFGYVEFDDVEGLKQALTLDNQSFQGRMIKIKIADPPRGGDSRADSSRDLSDWTRRGPLPDLPGRGGNRQPSDFGGERRMRDPALEARPPREINWERRGPLPPLAQEEAGPGPRDSSRTRPSGEDLGERGGSFRGPRPDRPDRAERPERPERSVTAAEKDFQWRDRMRPDAAAASPTSEAAETPSSPTAASAVPAASASRPRLNLQKRTVPDAGEASASATPSDAKASPFGAARPIDTATREKEIEEKRQQALQEKREADEKAKEERRQAKASAAAKAEEEQKEQQQEDEAKEESKEESKEDPKDETATEASGEQKVPIRSREPKEPKESVQNLKSRATEAGNWRSASGEQRGPRGGSGQRGGRGGPRGGRNEGRGGRANGAPAQQAATSDAEPNTPDEDGWTTVPKKGRTGRPLA